MPRRVCSLSVVTLSIVDLSRSRVARAFLLSAVVALGALAVPALARADGDPASDVLTSQVAFVPWDAHFSTAEAARLDAVIAAARRAGYPTRVAVIATVADLGSVTQLWRRPQLYAKFLGIELSLSLRGSVLVVMPDGDAVYDPGMPMAAAQAALTRSRATVGRRGFGALAIAAVDALARADGHAPSLPASPEQPVATSHRSSTDAGAWAAFAAGLILVLLAWTGSLRMRPLRLPRRASLPSSRD